MNVTHIEFKPLDSKRHNSEKRQGLEEAKLQVLDSSQIHHLVDGSFIDNSSVKSTQSKKIDTDELAHLKCVIKKGEENLSYLGYSIDKS
ncbi:15765_t:CDS:2 [Acaulospora colombiana]|uniref:15765_t:CDS:1 n=1 Tax=Acaulospora colombiana TaxID=27376 RepID=A0ACA9KLZ2_9GLOM|nr:15765_t:CDS:2 [Acaulospora colombiana]